MEHNAHQSKYSTGRRSFLRRGLAVAGAGAIGAGLLTNGLPAFAREGSALLTQGDVAILRFLAAIEIIESDLWQQYNELGGIQDSEVPGGSGSAGYTAALKVLDGDMDQYIHDNTEDEFTHFTFINAYLVSKGGEPVNLDKFRTLPSSKATGAQQIGRLTNLMQLTVDTSYWTKYRSRTKNPDFGDTFAQAIPGLSTGQFPAIPRSDADLKGFKPGTKPTIPDHLQAIANTAGFHFAFIEQGGTSLYPSLAQRVTNVEVLRVLLSIGPSEAMHFQTWQDKAGNAPNVTDGDLSFTMLNTGVDPNTGGPSTSANADLFQTNLIMPEPTFFLNRDLGVVSIARPTETRLAATGAVRSFVEDGLFLDPATGKNTGIVAKLMRLAEEADAARRRL